MDWLGDQEIHPPPEEGVFWGLLFINTEKFWDLQEVGNSNQLLLGTRFLSSHEWEWQ